MLKRKEAQMEGKSKKKGEQEEEYERGRHR
jgi:hypothetical protein